MPSCNGRDRVKVRQAGPTRNRSYRYIGEDGIERTCLRGRTPSLRVTDIPVSIVVVGHHPKSPAGKPDSLCGAPVYVAPLFMWRTEHNLLFKLLLL